MSYQQHQQQSQPISARCAVVTLSDTRTPDTDTSGKRLAELLSADGHTVAACHILPDDPAALGRLLDQLLADAGIDTIITNGGTGISRRDNTIAVIEQKLSLPLPGFGELFRMLSYEQIGGGAILSRATAGIAGSGATRKLLFALPGSTSAVELALTKLILPELRHLLRELEK